MQCLRLMVMFTVMELTDAATYVPCPLKDYKMKTFIEPNEAECEEV